MRILAVDDDQVALDLLEKCLSQAGFEQVTTALSGDAAIELVRDRKNQFDCILLDIEMPGKNGIETCADIRAIDAYRHTPVIMITRVNEKSAIERAFAVGATDYVTKPFEFFEVIARIRIAERLVQERQAAMDSYLALRPAPRRRTLAESVDATMAQSGAKIAADRLLPLQVFENYLERMTRADKVRIEVIAIQIEEIDRIFSQLPAEEFVSFLRDFVNACIAYAGRDEVFVTHVGNGRFLCASDQVGYGAPERVEAGILRFMSKSDAAKMLPPDMPLQISVGVSLQLPTTARPNFNRVLKVSLARLQSRHATKFHAMTDAG